jgi:hypothetical protein
MKRQDIASSLDHLFCRWDSENVAPTTPWNRSAGTRRRPEFVYLPCVCVHAYNDSGWVKLCMGQRGSERQVVVAALPWSTTADGGAMEKVQVARTLKHKKD